MTQKLFEELALSDDFMFCKIMENFLKYCLLLLFGGIGGIFFLSKK